MVTCALCSGGGRRGLHTTCRACEGLGYVPAVANWRPFEASKETIKDASEHNNCNLHKDCEEANERALASGGKRPYHCWSDDCEDCFGC